MSPELKRCLRVCGPVYLLFVVICPLGYFYRIDLFQSACSIGTMPAYITSLVFEQRVARIIGGYDFKWTLAALFLSYAVIALVWIICALSPWWLFIRLSMGKRFLIQILVLAAGYAFSIFLAAYVDFPSPD